MTITDFVHNYKLKNKATSNIKVYQIICSIGLRIVGIYLRSGPFESDIGIVNLYPSKGTNWVAYINDLYLNIYGCSPPKKLYKIIMERIGHCLYSEFKVQGLRNKRDSYCASYCLYVPYLRKVIGIDFISAVLNFRCQMI